MWLVWSSSQPGLRVVTFPTWQLTFSRTSIWKIHWKLQGFLWSGFKSPRFSLHHILLAKHVTKVSPDLMGQLISIPWCEKQHVCTVKDRIDGRHLYLISHQDPSIIFTFKKSLLAVLFYCYYLSRVRFCCASFLIQYNHLLIGFWLSPQFLIHCGSIEAFSSDASFIHWFMYS